MVAALTIMALGRYLLMIPNYEPALRNIGYPNPFGITPDAKAIIHFENSVIHVHIGSTVAYQFTAKIAVFEENRRGFNL
jgi:hypothetical protein